MPDVTVPKDVYESGMDLRVYIYRSMSQAETGTS